MSIEERCRREIEQLHDFFVRWFNAEVDETEEAFDRLDSVIADGFVLIDLDGDQVSRAELLRAIRDRWGRQADEEDRIEIETDDIHLLRSEGDVHLATYIEHQQFGASSNRRRSSALFRESADAPNGLEWLYVHETPVT